MCVSSESRILADSVYPAFFVGHCVPYPLMLMIFMVVYLIYAVNLDLHYIC